MYEFILKSKNDTGHSPYFVKLDIGPGDFSNPKMTTLNLAEVDGASFGIF